MTTIPRRRTAIAKKKSKAKRAKTPEEREELGDGVAVAEGAPEEESVDSSTNGEHIEEPEGGEPKSKAGKRAKKPKDPLAHKPRDPEKFRAKVLRAEGALEKASEELDQARAKLKLANAQHERAQDALHSIIRAEKDDGGPLFATHSDEGWRRSSMVEVFGTKLGKMLEQKLAGEIPHPTLEKLMSWLDNRPLTAIPGVGDATASKLDDALEDFWERNPQWTKGAKEAETS